MANNGPNIFTIALAVGSFFLGGTTSSPGQGSGTVTNYSDPDPIPDPVPGSGSGSGNNKTQLIQEIEDLKYSLSAYGWSFDQSWDRDQLEINSIQTLTNKRNELQGVLNTELGAV